MKTLIAVPAMDQVPTYFAQSLATLNRVGDTMVAFEIGSLVYTARNNLAKKAIELGADYVLWLDSDMVFNSDLLEQMFKTLKDKDLDILSGLYFRRVKPFTPIAFKSMEMVDGIAKWTEFEEIPNELFEVGAIGFGCVLMKTEIFVDVFMKFQDFFTPFNGVGEDIAFSWRARQCGYKIWIDPNIFLGHVGNQIITRAYYESFAQVKKAHDAK